MFMKKIVILFLIVFLISCWVDSTKENESLPVSNPTILEDKIIEEASQLSDSSSEVSNAIIKESTIESTEVSSIITKEFIETHYWESWYNWVN